MANRGDHTVPEFYLRQFRSETTLPRGDTFFHQHDRETGLGTEERPKDVLKRDRYYDVEFEDGERTAAFDEFLRRVESETAKLFSGKGFIADRRPPTEQERMTLAFFVATMEIRAPQLHELFGDLLVSAKKMQIDVHRHRLLGTPGLLSPDEVEELKKFDVDSLEMETNRSFVLATALSAGYEPMLRIIDGEPWTFLALLSFPWVTG